ncbi:hypothetical protein [Actinomadura decatromicini]|uniref:Toxin-antitoxin system HicB family antitoxin n=1 Tax=Actinomadura decatromicini TaxID=2604572 RepID=A0A5D3FCU6_9ACTN|nr:hypothetical protein [Actinomadura decatromicini]TYK45798.1 hypothetical protein FXF68_26525 [Actinomadura decatromicini]
MAERKKILLRLDPAVHDALVRWAGDELRSTNAQIEFLLRRALADAGRMPGTAGRMRGRGRPRKADTEPQIEDEHDEHDPPRGGGED